MRSGTPAWDWPRSLSRNGTPAKGPSPSGRAASTRAASNCSCTSTFSSRFSSNRAIAASASSSAETSPRRTSAACSVTSLTISSADKARHSNPKLGCPCHRSNTCPDTRSTSSHVTSVAEVECLRLRGDHPVAEGDVHVRDRDRRGLSLVGARLLLEGDDRPDDSAPLHGRERVLDVVERDRLAHHRIEVEPAVQVQAGEVGQELRGLAVAAVADADGQAEVEDVGGIEA